MEEKPHILSGYMGGNNGVGRKPHVKQIWLLYDCSTFYLGQESPSYKATPYNGEIDHSALLSHCKNFLIAMYCSLLI